MPNPVDTKERFEDIDEAARHAMDAKQADMWTCLPIIISKHNVDKNTVEANPALKSLQVNPDGSTKWVTLPKLLDAPIHFASGGGATITIPVKSGDEGLAVFSSRCIDQWHDKGSVQETNEYRMHDMSDSFILPGVRSKPRFLKNVNPDCIEIRNEKGDSHIQFNPGKPASTSRDGTVSASVIPTLVMTIQSGIVINSWAGGITHAAGMALPQIPTIGNIIHAAISGISHAAGINIPQIPTVGNIIHQALNGIAHAAGINIPPIPSPGTIIHQALEGIAHAAGINLPVIPSGGSIIHQAINSITHNAGLNFLAHASVNAVLGGVANVSINAGSSTQVEEMARRFDERLGLSINLNSPIVQVSANLKAFGGIDASGGFSINGFPIHIGGGGGGGGGGGIGGSISLVQDVVGAGLNDPIVTTVVGIQTRPVSAAAPANGATLIWNGTANHWEPSATAASMIQELMDRVAQLEARLA